MVKRGLAINFCGFRGSMKFIHKNEEIYIPKSMKIITLKLSRGKHRFDHYNQ